MSDEENDEIADRDSGSYTIEVPPFKDWSISSYYKYSDLSVDFEDLNDLNKQITAVNIALFKITEAINKAERKAKDYKIKYERSYRREYMNSQEKTEGAKKVWAELKVEKLENRYMYYEQFASELNRASRTLVQELRSLEAIGNNYRQQIKTV